MPLFEYAPSVVIPALLLATSFIAKLPSLVQQTEDFQKNEDALTSNFNPARSPNIIEEYDYVIIGAGSAGALVANRLSKDKNVRVLIVQDGGDPNPFANIPGLANELRLLPSTDYAYKMVKQKNACLSQEHQHHCVVSRGIGLGGTSNIYSMSINRGHPNDFDLWANLTGDPNWAYENVEKVFKKLEDYHGHFQPIDQRYHGTGGDDYVSAQQPEETVLPYTFSACTELGLPINVDVNANHSIGCGHLDLDIKDGIRWGSYNAYIKPILKRRNLKIYRYATATKINFDKDMHATSVTYVRHGVEHTVKAKLEVVLCAGAIDSPKLLMLSGIGPKDWLESVGIQSILDLPVGKKFQEHVGVNVEFTVNKSKIAFVPERDLSANVVEQYLHRGTGPLASPFFNPRAIVVLSSTEFNNTAWPDLELLVQGTYFNVSSQNGTFEDKILLQVLLSRPLSTGFLRLRSHDPMIPPVIDPQYFTNPSDLRRLIEGVAYGVKLLETSSSFQKIGIQLGSPPACRKHSARDKLYKCLIRYYTTRLCHPTGTVKMGADDDPTAVLDSKLRVRGTKNLRVIDSSIMPEITSGHLHTPTLMIGEIGAGFILEQLESSTRK